MPAANKPLANVMYISLPEDSTRSLGDFTVDPNVLIPIEVVGGDETWTMQNLTWEMIIAAMIKVIVYDTSNAHAGYYRDFVLAAKPDIINELSATGIEQANEKNYDVAEEIFAALRSLLPDEPDPALNLALVYEEHAKIYERGNRTDLTDAYLERTHALYTELCRRFPDNSRVLFNFGNFHLHMKNYVQAQKHLERFLEISVDERKNETVRTILGELAKRHATDELFREAYDFIRMGREREGIERIQTFLQPHPEVWNAWFLLGWAHRRLGEYREGHDAFVKALELGPDEPDTLNELAICQMELERFDKSEETLRKALRKDPENTKIVSNLGILAMKRGRKDEAKNYFLTVLELDSEDVIAAHYVSLLEE